MERPGVFMTNLDTEESLAGNKLPIGIERLDKRGYWFILLCKVR